ncbi:hypothetical protein LTR37_011162 [Vermiconidia calcicola]|uniref:Uncharacterized protein n=1 Tax=Vermiconidia calcicola TaxID=1690605 RepID=A0ACC3N301_9PEZI|nr:hypothetical protein LTR37_011162 [Vermiconidia calcicola]
MADNTTTGPAPDLPFKLSHLKASASQQYSLKNYNAAAELYSEAAEAQDEINGEMSPQNADLLYQYGRCLYHVAVSNSDVLGGKVAESGEEPKRKKRKVAKAEGSAAANGEGSSGGLISDALEDGEQKLAEDVVEAAVEEKNGVKQEGDTSLASKPFFHITGDENWTDSEDEDDADDAAADAEAEGEEDDFAIAYEILDVARVLLIRKLDEQPDNKAIKERLADTHDLQAEISLENERFQDAIKDTRDALALKGKLYPEESSLIAEAHFKLSLALEFASVTSTTEGEGGGEAAQVDETMRAEAAAEMEKAIASCNARIAKETEVLSTLSDNATKKAEQEKSIADVKEMVADMQQRLLDLRNPAVNLSGLNAEGAAGAEGVLGAMLGESKAEQAKRIQEATEKANDLTGLVKKGKKGKVADGGAGIVEGKGKRKAEDGVVNGGGKKVKFAATVEEEGKIGMMEPIEHLAERWLELDRDQSTRKEIQDLLHANDKVELEKRLRKRIAFGTAGLRASMKAGFAHMNSVIVLQASHGLAQYILNQQQTHEKGDLSVVLGYDARYNSEKFARLAAAAFLEKGFKVLWFGQLVHTPMVPFAVNHYAAAAGVMVTASHNPKNDNGYKVYWSNGCQIIPPHDAGIAAAINAVASVDTWDTTKVDQDPGVEHIFDEAKAAYFDSIRELVAGVANGQVQPFVYTPMHGVGLPFVEAVAEMLPGCTQSMRVVKAQGKPDPEFPTVPFPNPEEKGALDLAKKEAERNGSSLVLANDPDADRFAVAERLESGEWHQLTGNQLGVLLASHVLDTYKGEKAKLAMLASTVSSRMLAAVAKKEGFVFRETLTGFKWLGNVAQDLQQNGYHAVYAYEEAIGYMFPEVVWDKDGIAAAAAFLEACSQWQQQGLTPYSRLQQLYEKYGYFEDANTYLISPSPDTTNRVFTDIRRLDGGSRPENVGKRKIRRWRDLTLGYDSGTKDNRPELPVDATAQMITCELDDVVFTARGSGTEPKIKLYIEARDESSAKAKVQAYEVLQDLLKEWFGPEYGLRLAGS